MNTNNYPYIHLFLCMSVCITQKLYIGFIVSPKVESTACLVGNRGDKLSPKPLVGGFALLNALLDLQSGCMLVCVVCL